MMRARFSKLHIQLTNAVDILFYINIEPERKRENLYKI